MYKLDNRLPYRICLIATFLALIVVMFGAYTRLKDAGLGCPDWPGCYGKIIAPDSPQRLTQAELAYPGQDISEQKAWTEMIHRYLAGTLGILVFSICVLTLRRTKLPNQPTVVPILLIGLIVLQALLGKWTVTMRLLPVVVMSHLLGGMVILALLWFMALRLGNYFKNYNSTPVAKFRSWAALGLIIVILQIFLGGWTSTNYAALICLDFPACHGQLWPATNFHTAFNFWLAFNSHTGLLDNISLITIQMVHRAGALVTGVYLTFLSLWILISSRSPTIQRIAVLVLILLIAQICLGALNVLFLLPVPIAIAHNGIAALLLLTMTTLNFILHRKPQFYS